MRAALTTRVNVVGVSLLPRSLPFKTTLLPSAVIDLGNCENLTMMGQNVIHDPWSYPKEKKTCTCMSEFFFIVNNVLSTLCTLQLLEKDKLEKSIVHIKYCSCLSLFF